MLIGLDFDNTLVCYDALFHQVAVERGLVPADLPVVKEQVRDHLRAHRPRGRVDRAAGLRLRRAHGRTPTRSRASPSSCAGARARRAAEFVVVSHKTLHPSADPPTTCTQSARGWLERPHRAVIGRGRVYFELTKEAKLARIAALGCTHFVDDLPEFLTLPEFPAGVDRILFDPHRSEAGGARGRLGAVRRVESWAELGEVLAIPAAR